MTIECKDIARELKHKQLRSPEPPNIGRGSAAFHGALDDVGNYARERIEPGMIPGRSPLQQVIDLLRAGSLECSDRSHVAYKRLARLTPREADVLDGLVAGKTTKVLAYELEISPKTVEIHRASIMKKMECDSLFALGRAWEAAVREVVGTLAHRFENGGTA